MDLPSRPMTALRQALPELPEAVLVCILQHVPLQPRLSCCAVVCRAWAEAVTSTTADINIPSGLTEQRTQQLQSWLQCCGKQVRSADIKQPCPFDRLLQLPCSQLTRLQQFSLVGGTLEFDAPRGGVSTRSSARSSRAANASSAPVRAAAAASSSSTAQLLPQLQQLSLVGGQLPVRQLQQVSAITTLTSLTLEGEVITKSGKSYAPVSQAQVTAALHSALPQLRDLSELCLVSLIPWVDHSAPSAPLAHVSAMQHLQRLTFDDHVCSDIKVVLPHLPDSLTYLRVRGAGVALAPADMQAAARLSRLQHLEVEEASFTPSILANWPGLRRLSMRYVDLARSGDDILEEEEEDDPDMQGLLAAVGCLTKLQHLTLTQDGWFDAETVVSPEVLQLFASLTASSHLTALSLDSHESGLPLPPGALQYVFPEGRVLPHLQELNIKGELFPLPPGSWCLDTSDIDRIGRCCPHVVTLYLREVVKPSSSMQGLLGMQGSLQDLALSGDAFDDDAAAVMAQLTRLTSLQISSNTVTPVGLEKLTALRALQYLDVHNVSNSKPLAAMLRPTGKQYLQLTTTSQLDEAPDVWRQLAAVIDSFKARQTSKKASKRGGRKGKKRGKTAAKH